MNRTERALISRGLDLLKAKKVVSRGYTLESLPTLSADVLKELNISKEDLDKIFNEDRPPIPEDIVINLLYKSKRTCCICRDSSKSIIIHHIEEWSKSKNNSEENLVVLCMHHHDEAHTKKELSKNLTSDEIKKYKEKWESEVVDLTEKLLTKDFKELNVIPIRLSYLKQKWFNFLKSLNMKIEVVNDVKEKFKYDFKIFGKRELLLKVYDIVDISELVNSDILINEFNNESFFDSLIVLGEAPFESDGGYYDEPNIQIGWVYSHGEGDWDNVMLKKGYDISNSKFYVENFLYPSTYWKDFLTSDDFDEVFSLWNKA